ncbi:hypothetical protein IGI37_002441 [Enterococcus sp. AZ194]|uniref:DNA-directed RNA polymerase subunit beta n=1 Tax=Enterococcus sp. AZ194 TaxID=2774629 RepID=UPI003F29F201
MGATRHILFSLLKIVVVIVLIMLLFVIGMMIGYGVIGGGKPLSVFSHDLWDHIFTFFK